MPPESSEPAAVPNVVYLTGWGRSGSTVLNRLLVGDGVVAVGELRLLWLRGVVQRQDCSCGNQWDSCELWEPVVNAAAARRGTGDLTAFGRELHAQGKRAGRALALRTGRTPRHVPPYAETLGEVYRDVARFTGARLVVDSSKDPTHALVAKASGANVTVVHVIRDPRAVVWSHQRAKVPPPGVKANTTPTSGPGYVATRWLLRNSFIDRVVQPDLRIRYEDLVRNTDDTVHKIFAAAGVAEPTDWHGVEHLIAGNPNRFDTTRPKLREDAEWRTSQPAWQQRVTTLLCRPLMTRYGYH